MVVLEGFVQTLNQRRGSQPIPDELRDKLWEQLSDACDLVAATGVADLDTQTRSYLLMVIDDAIAVIQRARRGAACSYLAGDRRHADRGGKPVAAPQRTAFHTKLGVVAVAVAASFAQSYVDGVGSHLAELTFDSVLLLTEYTGNS